MPSFLMIQWGIVGFFVIIHFLLGFLRGSSKSLYFTIVSFVMTVVTLLIVANISLNWIFGMVSVSSIVSMAQTYTGNLGIDSYLTFLEDPAIAGFIIAILDLIIRIIAFVIFYPIIKFSLTLAIFKPIWKHAVKKALLKKQNENAEDQYMSNDTSNKKFVPSRKLKKSIFGRLFGGAMGAVRGFVVAFIFLIPIIVIAGFTSNVSDALPAGGNANLSLSNGEEQIVAIPSEIQDILDNINEMNQSGLGAMTRSIMIGEKSIDRYIFDQVFTTKVVDATDTVTKLNFGEELEGIVGIVGILMEGGYLDEGFDFQQIDETNLEDIEEIFTYISQSDLLNYMIPFAIREGLPIALNELTEYENPYDRPETAAALEVFTSIEWSDEFMNLYGIIEAVLEFGSIEDLMAYADNPSTLLELTPEEGVLFTDILRAFGDMESLVLINAGLDYAITLDEFKSAITWVEPDDVEDYIANRLGFIIDNPDFFIGEDGEISKLADLIEIFFSEDVDLPALIDGISDPGAFLDAQDPEWVGDVFDGIAGLDLLVESIPMGVDYGLYTFLGDQVEATLADDITTALDAIEWDDEIVNVGNIYAEVLQLGLSSFLGTETDTFGLVDQVVVNHMDSVRAIVESIFEGSELVNVAIEIASPAIVDKFVTDSELKDLVNEALMSDPSSGVVDFSFGTEVNSFLTILESVYQFSTASELGSFSTMTQDQKVELFSKFGSLTDLEYADFEEAFLELQLLDRMGASALTYARDTLEIEQLYVPTDVDLGHDVGAILGLAYHAAKYTYDNRLDYDSYEEIDFAPLLADTTFRSYLLSTVSENHSNLLFTNIAYNIQLFSEDEALSSYVAIPTTLTALSPEDALWETEVNAFLGAILDLGASFEGSSVMSLSVRDVLTLTEDTSAASLDLFTQFADPVKAADAFGSLDSSQILRTSLVNIINSLGESTLDSIGYAMSVPDIALDGEMLESGMIVELINGLAVVAQDAFETMNVTTLAEFNELEGTSDYLNAFSQLEDESIDALSGITIIRGMISDALLDPGMQAFLVDTINDAQDLFDIDANFFNVDPILLDTEGALKAEEVSALFIAVRSLGLTDSEALANVGIDTFTGLIGRNIDPDTGEDDFDRVFGSGYLYITLDKIIQLDAIGTFVSDTLTESLGSTVSDFDLTLPIAMLGNAIDDELIEVDRIPVDEFRRIVEAIAVLGDLDAIGLDTFSNLVDPSLPEDDFTTFIASDFIYVVLARLFENEGFGDYIGEMLAGAFGDDPITLTMGAPEDAKGTTGVETGLMTRYELRRLMISFDMLGLSDETEVSISTITDMIGANDVAGEDDFDRFLMSKYLDDKISQLLLSQQVIELIAAGQFDYGDFVLPASATIAVGTGERLTNQEIYDLFYGLTLLGDLSDMENLDIGLDTVTSLDSTEVTQLLASSYLYVVVDLIVKSQNEITLPSAAFEDAGEYIGMIKKDEIQDIFLALEILSITDLTDVDPATITIGDITDLLDQTDSAIVQSLLSQAIIEALDPDDEGKIPDDAFEGLPADGLLTSDEIDALIDALNVLGGNDPDATITGIDVANITVGDVDELSDTSSAIIKQLISDAIIDVLGAGSIPDEAYGLSSSSSQGTTVLLGGGVVQLATPAAPRLTDAELEAMIDALVILANNDLNVLVTAISTDVNVGQAVQLKGTTSFIIKQLVSDALVDTLGTAAMPADAFIDGDVNGRLLDAEIDLMIDALVILANGNSNLLVTDISTDITVGQVKDLVLLPSLVTKQLISDTVIEQIDPLDEGKIPDEARVGGISTNRLSDTEITAMIDALEILSGHDDNVLVTLLSTDVTVGQVKELKGTVSYIIKQLVSDAVIDVITAPKIPLEAYIGADANNRLTDAEIDAMIDALDILGDDLDLVTSISTDVTVGQAVAFKGTPSFIIKQLVSDAVIDVITAPKIPLEAYIGADANNRLTDAEIDAMIDALDILGDDLDLVTSISTDVTVGQAVAFEGTPSFIIKQLVSDAVIDVITAPKIPLEAYIGADANNRLTDAEIDAMIDALDILGDDLDLVTSISTDVTIGQVKGLALLTSSITEKLISDSIIDAVGLANVPDDAYLLDTPGNNLKTTEVDAMVLALEILAGSVVPGDVDDVSVSTVSTNVTIGQAQALDTSGTGSSIIKFIISDSIITMITAPKIPVAAYHLVYIDRLSDQEITDMLAVLSILGDSGDLVTSIDTNINIGQLKAIEASPSLIMGQLISDSIIDAVGAANVPDDAYLSDTPGNNLKSAEVSAMIVAIEVLAGSVVPGDVDHILVSAISTNVTIGQAQALDTSGTGSSIIKFIISDSIITMITAAKIPNDAYIASNPANRLSDQEITDMLAVLSILGDSGDLVTSIDTNINIGQLKAIEASPSLIMGQLISDSIIDAVGVANVPDDAYLLDTPGNNLKAAEVSAMIVAIEVLAGSVVPGDVDHILVSAISTNVTIGQTQSLDTSATGSAIIKFIVSDSIITMITVPKIPTAAYHLVYTDRLSDQEITDMLGVLSYLGNPGDSVSSINVDITIGQLKNIQSSPSLIMGQLISDSIIDAVGVANVPDDAYLLDTPGNNLKAAEVSAMIVAIEVLAGSVVPGDVDHILVSAISTDVTIGQTQALDTSGTGSSIIKFIISDSIITMITAAKIPNDAYIASNPANRLSDQEITDMLGVLSYLGNPGDSVSSINVDITIGQLKNIQSSPSIIMASLISTSIIDAVGLANVPDDAYLLDTPGNNLKAAEVSAMILALEVFAGSTVPGDRDTTKVSAITTTNVTVGQTQSLSTNNSAIIKFIISDSVITMFGVGNIPAEAYHLTYTDRLSDEEIVAIADALAVLGAPGDSVATISTDVTVGQTQALDTTATGSVIIKQMISDSVVTMLGAPRIPNTAYIASNPANRLTDSEIGYMQDSLLPLAGGNSNTLVSAITVTESTLSVATLKSFPDQSIIMNRMISTAIITNMTNIPTESYVPLSTEDILRSEIDYLLDALDILGIGTSGAGSIGAAAITFEDLYTISAYGESDPLGYSPIIDHILSTPMISAVTDVRGGYDYGVPSTAYRNTYDLLHDEIVGLIDALAVIGDVPSINDPATTTIADISINTDSFDSTLLSSLIALDKLIVYRLISKGINDASLANDDAFAEIGDVNYDPDLNNPLIVPTPALNDIKIDEMNGLVDAMVIFGISDLSSIAGSIDATALASLTDTQVDTLLDNNNTIVYYMIDDVVQAQPLLMLQLTPADFELVAPFRVKRASMITLLKNNN